MDPRFVNFPDGGSAETASNPQAAAGRNGRESREEDLMSFDLSSVPRQKGRVAIVTGANTGLGFETAKAFATKGITTVMACRTLARGPR